VSRIKITTGSEGQPHPRQALHQAKTKSREQKMAGLLCESKEAGLGSERQRNGDGARVGAGRIGHGRPGRHSKTGCLFKAKTEFPIRPRQCQKIRGSGADECGTFRPDLMMLADGEITPMRSRGKLVRFYLPDVLQELREKRGAVVSFARGPFDCATTDSANPRGWIALPTSKL
jgi:hypothetical protein